jgi:hypothetical protein
MLAKFKSRYAIIQAGNGLVEAALRGGHRRANGDALWGRAHPDRGRHRVCGRVDHRDIVREPIRHIDEIPIRGDC